jgi:hypothetical protein
LRYGNSLRPGLLLIGLPKDTTVRFFYTAAALSNLLKKTSKLLFLFKNQVSWLVY